MPKFNYSAMDGQGKEQKGTIDAENDNDAVAQLKDQGLFPTSITEAKGGGGGGGGGGKGPKSRKKKGGGGGINLNIQLGTPQIRHKDLLTFTRQLATLLDAGLPLVRGLRTLEKQSRDPGMVSVVGDLADGVEGGQTFSEALGQQPKSFNRLYVNMVKAGEASGAMEQVLNRLAEFMEKSAKLKAKVKAALVYPIAVLVISLAITSGLMIFIVPKFKKIFEEMLSGEPLPGLTQIVMNISDFMLTKAWMGLVGGIVGFIALKIALRTKLGAYIFDLVSIKLPPFGGLVTKVSVARFCSTLSTLMSSGVSVLNALQIVRDTSGNQVVANAVQIVHDAVKEGEGMSKPLESTRVFPGMVVSMIEVGEETGALPEMLSRIAVSYEEEVDRAVEALTSLIEPVMIIFLAIIVGGIVIALFMPLIKLIDSLGG
jgi:type IV pilus assembly protein PilC